MAAHYLDLLPAPCLESLAVAEVSSLCRIMIYLLGMQSKEAVGTSLIIVGLASICGMEPIQMALPPQLER